MARQKEQDPLDQNSAFKRQVDEINKHEWNYPHAVNANLERRFMNSYTSLPDKTNILRGFYRPNPHPTPVDEAYPFTPFVYVQMMVSNVSSGNPDRFSEAHIVDLYQWDELERMTNASSSAVRAEIDLGRTGHTDLPDFGFCFLHQTSDYKGGILITGDRFRGGRIGISRPNLEQMAIVPLVISDSFTHTTIKTSEDLTTLSIEVLTDKLIVACELPIAKGHFEKKINELRDKGKLDDNLFWHALDSYGPWDESFKDIDWAGELGIEIDVKGEIDWNKLTNSV